MAEHAHKEPTMEEILASIRKIISEDDAPAPTADGEEAAPSVEAPKPVEPIVEDTVDDDMFEEFDLSDLDLAQPEPEPEPEPEVDLAQTAVDDVLTADAAGALDDLLDDESVLEPLTADLVEPETEAPSEALVVDDLLIEDDEIDVETFEPDIAAFQPAEHLSYEEPEAPTPAEPAPAEEEPMQALTAEATDNAAAGALAKLVSKLDMGSENTLEGMVRELLKPMIKEWLDENLPAIVEDKVELEVQRISRLAR